MKGPDSSSTSWRIALRQPGFAGVAFGYPFGIPPLIPSACEFHSPGDAPAPLGPSCQPPLAVDVFRKTVRVRRSPVRRSILSCWPLIPSDS